MAKDKLGILTKVEFYLTPDNAKIIENIEDKMVTPSFYINAAIEATAGIKKFKEMRKEEKSSQKADAQENNQQ